MSRWQEQFENHQIHQTLEQLQEWLNVDLDDIAEGEAAELRRFRKILDMFSKTISVLDVEVAPTQQLDSLNQQLRHQNLWNQVQSFSSNKNVAHITSANNHLTTLIPYLTWLVPYTQSYSQVQQVTNLQESVDQVFDGLSQKKEQLVDEIESLTKGLEQLADEKAELEAVIGQRRQEVDQQISQWQQQFSDAQEKRSSIFNEWKSALDSDTRKQTTELVSDVKQKTSDLSSATEEQLEEVISKATQKHKDIKELYELASGDSMSGGYAQMADKERLQANIWRGVAIGFICVTALWIWCAYTAFDSSTPTESHVPSSEVQASQPQENPHIADQPMRTIFTDKPFNWHRFLLSVSLTGVLLFGAAYSGQQSNRHRESEKKMRWFALQMKALDPYISSLDPAVQKDLKKTLSEKFFNGVNDQENLGRMVDEHAVGYITKAITDGIKAAKG